jgi:hypothetical protein
MEKQKIEEKDIFKVFSQKLCGWLLLNGFRLIGTRSNLQRKDFNVFLFNKSDVLLQCKDYYDNNRDELGILVKKR